MKFSSPTLRCLPFAVALAVLVPACSSDGWDPTANMDSSGEESFVVVSDGEVDIGALGALGKYIRSQRQLNRSEKQILDGLARKQIAGYRAQQVRILEQKRDNTARSHQAKRNDSKSRHQTKVAKIRQSPAPEPEMERQVAAAEREHQAETAKAEQEMKRELELIDTEIQREKRRTYVVPVNDPKGAKNRSVVLIDANNRVKDAKIYQVDRSVVDLAKVAAREDPDVAVLTNQRLNLPEGL